MLICTPRTALRICGLGYCGRHHCSGARPSRDLECKVPTCSDRLEYSEPGGHSGGGGDRSAIGNRRAGLMHQLNQFPLILLPTFIVPVIIVTHGLMLMRLGPEIR